MVAISRNAERRQPRNQNQQKRSLVLAVTATICLAVLVFSWKAPYATATAITPPSSTIQNQYHQQNANANHRRHDRALSGTSGSSRRCGYGGAWVPRGGGSSLEETETSETHAEEDNNGEEDRDDQEDSLEQTPTETGDELSSLSPTEIATSLRLEGKEHHDRGDFIKAAEIFQRAADTLLENNSNNNNNSSDDNGGNDNDGANDYYSSENYATCRLHQALCCLKSQNYDACIEACTDVLQDGSSSNTATQNASNDANANANNYSPAITARAYHRRAKAKMALGDNAGALQDARTASFLGDGKAVNLYGKLMRETTSPSSSDQLSSLMNPLLSSSSSSSPNHHSALLDSLLSSSGAGGVPDFSPAGLLLGSGGLDGGGGALLNAALGSGGGAGMAKSVVQNLVKRLDDESTQQTICGLLQNTSKAQLLSVASMAGIDNGGALAETYSHQLDKLVEFCHGVTPKKIRRTVKGTKVLVYFARLIRRTIKVVNKYKSLIVAACVLQWTKSAITRPLPVNAKAIKKAAKLAAKAAAKEALGEAMKASRAGFF
mmetsp:Transcript_23278/g.47466  ORF Transcript_23278/g.47466 Transcript_23278/m.47466 type:complete len:548 (+) Transcript_23278:198-1841(+)|eukprot:CAMPEP_0168189406 /NCGR_PEP_ID=MMETSP0139_2-20121125/16331_1 /TAXON_ID=44445 /ORGANISM="Pseudo-nitzschia australis, Strain 10249 10 AB" /LENGTH=547 /DNA_ID=CAMNT_0008112243 /DNA_START=424 /DNA_END=2067 /DNA_ORIENTATION=-